MNVNENSCRLCLKTYKSKKLKSIKSLLDNETIAEAIFSISGITTLNNTKFPSKICIKCVENLSLAKQVRKLCIDSDKYLRSIYSDNFYNDIKNEPQELNYSNVPLQVEFVQKLEEDVDDIIEEDMGMDDFDSSQYLPSDYFSDNGNKIIESNSEVVDTNDASDLFSKPVEHINPTTQKKVARKPPPKQKPLLINNQKVEEADDYKKSRPIYQCMHCGKICQDRTKLTSHERCHEEKPTKRFECDLCGRLFALKCYVFSHMTNVHTVDKRYNCEYCGKGFAKIVNYRNHIRAHTNEKPFACTQCPKAFYKKQLLEVHTRVHTGERPYKCEHCEKTYAHYTDWRRHLMTHTGERPYQCKSCGKGFIKRSCLTSHEKSHLNSSHGLTHTRNSSRISQ